MSVRRVARSTLLRWLQLRARTEAATPASRRPPAVQTRTSSTDSYYARKVAAGLILPPELETERMRRSKRSTYRPKRPTNAFGGNLYQPGGGDPPGRRQGR